MEENRPVRKFIPIGIRLQACLILLGFDPTEEEIEWDHFPALGLRTVNEEGDDYMPAQLDPRFIRPMTKAHHLAKTTGRKGESKFSSNGGGDTSRAAKAKRTLAEAEARVGMTDRQPGQRRERKGSIQSRGFPKDVTRTFKGEVKPRKTRRGGPMNSDIIVQPQAVGNDLANRIAWHNWRVMFTWRHVGSNCKPFTPSTVPAAMADVSRVPAAEHGALSLAI